MKTTNNKICESCGAKVMEYKHGLMKGLARGLYKLAEAGGGPINLNELKLNISQQTNFYKLRYWDLVRKADSSNLKGGEWTMTPTGWSFIRDQLRIPKHVWSFRGKRIRFDGKEILFSEVTDGYKYRNEYAEEAKRAPLKLK